MERDLVMAALCVLDSCTAHEPPNRDEVATLAAQPENIGKTAPDDMARSVIERYLNEKQGTMTLGQHLRPRHPFMSYGAGREGSPVSA